MFTVVKGGMKLTVKHIVSEWPSAAQFARDISTDADQVPVGRVRRWRDRNSIPAKYFGKILRAAHALGYPLNYADLGQIHDRED